MIICCSLTYRKSKKKKERIEREAEEDKGVVGEEIDRGSNRERKSVWNLATCIYSAFFQQLCLCSSLVNTRSNGIKCHAGFSQDLQKDSVYGGFAMEMCFGCLHLNCYLFKKLFLILMLKCYINCTLLPRHLKGDCAINQDELKDSKNEKWKNKN